MTEQHSGVKDLSSLTKNGPVLPTVECTVLTTGQAGKSQDISLCEYLLKIFSLLLKSMLLEYNLYTINCNHSKYKV